MKMLNSNLMKIFLREAGDHLKGEWILVGGTLLPALGLNVRATLDIDLVGLSEKEASQVLQLMQLAEHLGLSVESINQSASFFLNKVGYKKRDLLVLHKGQSAIIYRPSVELYWKLKIERLSSADALDCQHYLHYCLGQKDRVNFKELSMILRTAQKREQTPEMQMRLQELKALLQQI